MRLCYTKSLRRFGDPPPGFYGAGKTREPGARHAPVAASRGRVGILPDHATPEAYPGWPGAPDGAGDAVAIVDRITVFATALNRITDGNRCFPVFSGG